MFAILREFWVRQFRLGSETGPIVLSGTGSPEGVVSAPLASTYHREDGGAGTSLYIKETPTGATGWVAVAPGTGGGGTETHPMNVALALVYNYY